MDLTEISTAVRELFGDVDSVQFPSTQVTRVVNWGLSEVARRTMMVRGTSSFVALDGLNSDRVGGVPVPTDFYKEIDVVWNGTKLTRVPYDTFFQYQDTVVFTTSPPQYYTVSPIDKASGVRRLLFYPYQNYTQAVVLQLVYIGKPAALVAGADVPKLPEELHYAIVFFAASLLAGAESDIERARYFKGQAMEEITNWSTLKHETGYNENVQVREDGSTVRDYYD